MNSFQDSNQANSPATATPGSAIGKTTRVNTPKRSQPSTSAASSTATGMASKLPTRIHATNGNVLMRCASTNPSWVSTNPHCRKRTAIGKAMPTSGTMRLAKSPSNNPYFHGHDSREITYAAGAATPIAANMVHVATARLLLRGGHNVSEASTAFQCASVRADTPKAGWGVKMSWGGLREIFTMRYNGNSVKRATSTLPPYHQGNVWDGFIRPPRRDVPPAPDSSSDRRRSNPSAASRLPRT